MLPQRFVEGLAGELLLEELGDVLPVQQDFGCWLDSRSLFWLVHLRRSSGLTAGLRPLCPVADVADEAAWKINNNWFYWI